MAFTNMLPATITLALVLSVSSHGFSAADQPGYSGPLATGGNRIIVKYSFTAPQITAVIKGGERFDHVVMTDAPTGGEIGRPALPARAARILLPPGTEVERIQVLTGPRIRVGDRLLVEPVEYPVPLSLGSGAAAGQPVLDSVVYARDRFYPDEKYREIGAHTFRGYRLLILRLQPVEYNPRSGELYYYSDLTIVVDTKESPRRTDLFRGRVKDAIEMSTRVDNPEAVAGYPALARSTAEDYDLLMIVHPPWLIDAVQPLKDYHDTTGILTEIHTTASIGSYDPDVVRDYIRTEYLNHGIEYVLIVGDDHVLPAKDFFVASWEYTDPENPPYYDYHVPTDMYLGCLDGTFNYDGDSLWGEPTDGEAGGDVDLLAEVYVGRAPVDDITDAERFVAKTLDYLTAERPYLRDFVLAGEWLYPGQPPVFAAPYMDELLDGSDHCAYTTVGIPTDLYAVDQLYDRDWPSWPAAEMISRINDGQNVINHLGHCIDYYAMKMFEPDVAQLINEDYCFIYTQGCYAGSFDSVGCMAEYFTADYDHGAFAVVMNARYGWGSARSACPTDGPSHRFNREFWDAVFNPAENLRELGRANQDSKEDNLYRIDEPAARWCYYQLNLFGDPTVALKQPPCICEDYCDLDVDGIVDPLDVAIIVNYVYRQLDSRAPLSVLCPRENGDWDCSEAVDPVDVAYYVNFVYKTIGAGPGNPCD